MKRHLAASLSVALLLLSGAVRAGLPEDTQKLQAEWKKHGEVIRLQPRLLERGDVRPLLLRPEWLDEESDDCLTVAVLSARSINFVLRFLPAKHGPSWLNREWPEPSIAGAAQLTRCGARKALFSRLAIEMRSPRGVVEFLAVRSESPLPSLLKTLAHRDPGPATPLPGSGPRPKPAPLADRVQALERRLGREGAVQVNRELVEARADGSGDTLLRLEEGCHRVDILGASGSEVSQVPDIDVELVTVPDADELTADRTESTDASVLLCVGGLTIARMNFVGALPSSPVMVMHARWDLPSGLPKHWGPAARGRLAAAIGRRHARAVSRTPIYVSLGVQGATLLPIEVVPGRCYLVAAATIRGEGFGFALAAQVGNVHLQNHAEHETGGTVLAFCSSAERRALIEVDARGRGLAWLLGVWQTGQIPIGGLAQ